MKYKNITVVLVLVTAIVLSFIYPLIYHYTDKTIPSSPPPHHTYDEAIQTLRDSIKAQAARNKCKKFILPSEKIAGNPSLVNFFPSLKDDIYLALASYKKWKVKVSTEEAVAMQKRLEKKIDKWKNETAVLAPFLKKSMHRQAENAFNIRYSAEARLTKIRRKKGDDLLLILTVNNENTQDIVFKTEVSFIHPLTLAKWNKILAAKKARLERLKKRSDFSLKLVYLFTGLLILWLLFLAGRYLYLKYVLRKRKEYFLIEIQKRQELADNGHFVAAYELVEKYLKYFPDDSEVQAFRERLLDFTNNDPKKAQVAFVKDKKLQLRLQLAKDDPRQAVLSPDEKQQITALLPYNPQLKKSFLALEAGEKRIQDHKEFASQLKIVKATLSTGKIYEAQKLYREILEKYPDEKENTSLKKLADEISQKIENAEKKLAELFKNLTQGKIIKALQSLKEIRRQFPWLPKTEALQETMNRAEEITRFSLLPKKHGKKIAVYCGTQWLLGRSDEITVPDIDFHDKRVSRKHARIFVVENKLMMEDLNSTGGTYINGKKTTRQPLKNGDLINLGKIITLKISLFYTEKGEPGGLILVGQETNYLLLISYIPLAFNTDGLCLGSNGFTMYYQADRVLFSLGTETFFPVQGKEITLKNNKYTVEVHK